jgi:sulfite exporter TauE/SafE
MSVAVALSTGLLQGFLHCAGMCGPFVLAYSLSLPAGGGPPAFARVAPLHLAHNAGRIAAFAALGVLFGWIGSFVDAAARLTGLQARAGRLGGALMVAWAVDQARTGHGGGALERWSPLQAGPLRRAFRRLLGRRDPASALVAGALLGLHPCGLLFAMLLTAAATASPLRGGLTLLAFGVGTLPALLGVAAAGTLGGARLRGRFFGGLSAAIVGLGGVLFALRGLAVNGWVPHVWPWLF